MEERENVMRRLATLALGFFLCSMWPTSLAPLAQQQDEDTQVKYQRALQEMARLQQELDAARQEIVRLKQQLENAQAAPPGAWLTEGNAALGQHKYPEAIAAYTKAIEARPHEAKAYRHRGIAYERLGDYAHAIEDFSRTIELDPQDAVIYNQRGIAHYHEGNLPQAEADFAKAIALNPNLAEAYNNRAILSRQLGNYRQARDDFRLAAQLGLTHAAPYLHVLHDEIRLAQERLHEAGFSPGVADGVPGPQTTAALRQYQRQQGLAVTGRLDEATRQALGLQAGLPPASPQSNAESTPHFVHQPKPDYPAEARQQGWEGTVTLRLEMLADGTVGAVEVARSSGYPLLDTTAQQAATTWRHKPAMHNGQPVTRWVSLQVHFALDQAAQTEPQRQN
jgi:TonB family protein